MAKMKNSFSNWLKGSPALLSSLFLTLGTSFASTSSNFLPLPDDIYGAKKPTPPQALELEEILEKIGPQKPEMAASLPDKISVQSKDAQLDYQAEEGQFNYHSDTGSIRLITDNATELSSKSIKVSTKTGVAELPSSFLLYHGDSLSVGESGNFNWNTEEAEFRNLRTKINGILIRAESAVYKTDEKGQKYLALKNTFLSTHDVEKPSSWIGFDEMRIYPGSHGKLTGLNVGTPDNNIRVPILGWMTLTHSLNPKEGYLPWIGTKSNWGFYSMNSYGFLLGNRRVEGGIPTSDYILTLHVDYRVERGLGYGLDLEEPLKLKKYPSMTGLSLYYVSDTDPNINPTSVERTTIDSERYRIALQGIWDLNDTSSLSRQWRFKANINILSDEYVLPDYFEEISEVNDKPDNTIAVTGRGQTDETSFVIRFAPNDFYIADERAEMSYYRVRQPINKSAISYETRNSFGVMRQSIPTDQLIEYQTALNNITDSDVADYYTRMLNTSAYARLSSIHEFTASYKAFSFLNITPKAGLTFNGYYDVEGVGSENRAGAFAGCDFDFKFHRKYSSFQSDTLGIDGITHTIHPYASLSHNSITSSDELIPQINTWSSALSGSTNNPMPLDLCGFVGPDGWSTWTVMRPGIQNILTTTYDQELRTLLRWNAFVNVNFENPVAENTLSNIYSLLEFSPNRRFTFTSEMQFPAFGQGDEFIESNHSVTYQATRWLELRGGHRYLRDHSVQEDANQISTWINVRINENYNVAMRWYYDFEDNEIPIQQYSLFRNVGAWQIGATVFLRNNGGERETGFGISFTLRETETALPVNFY